ncbi:class I glutamine amidotransferase-like protein [Didymella exigua CBS 183.55]|uniref:Class I glutamine amidotransferase-like protein n=1 Tax=Didymella exigua CBS 183.55 TaxID=1150837 RepID=A0A6A5RKU2_9PLEO|nr:class I glutamine amidotransferase-like protein [Didymella exigua CBS 183.55]KAF1927594.1 class I glutamine amidotransferase-like protein [Didymella exigua CBS 183.55]
MAQTLHIAIFNTDIPVPEVSTTRASSYGQIFHALLSAAATRTRPHTVIKSTEYDTRKLEYPSTLDDVDLILITGSISSAYDDIPWVHQLERYIVDVYRDHPQVKWFGSCFGHQIIAQALLKQYSVRVDAEPRGWEVGVKKIAMDARFRSDFAKLGFEVPESMRMQFVHGDFVVVPDVDALPDGWSVMGSTPWCANQGMMQEGKVLTFQGHFEFDRFVNGETIKTFFARKAPEWLEESLKAVDADDDAELAADMVLHFAMQKTPAEQGRTYERVGGLVTPPEEV